MEVFLSPKVTTQKHPLEWRFECLWLSIGFLNATPLMNARSVRCAVIQEKSWPDDNLTGKDPLGGSAFAKETSVRRNNYDECHDHYR